MRVAVALSFDSDHETIWLRDGQTSPGRLSQGEYGARAAVPRILRLLDRRGIPVSFFVPAVCALLRPDEVRGYAQAATRSRCTAGSTSGTPGCRPPSSAR